MDFEFSHVYKNLLIHHLERSEIEHELTIRAVQFEATETRAAVQRRLRDRLKEEREKNVADLDFIRCFKSVEAEIKEIDDNLSQIRNYLEKNTRFEGIRESLKTRLVHYFERTRRVQQIADKDEDLQDLDQIVCTIREMMNTHFPAIGPTEVINEQVIQQIVQTLSNLKLIPSNTNVDAINQSRIETNSNQEDYLLDEAIGGNKEVEPANHSGRRPLKSLR